MKTISVVIPCYNEEENVRQITDAVRELFRTQLQRYDYEILIIDNDSRDRTRDIVRMLCAEDPKVRAIFNAKNFGQFNSPYYGLLQSTGDASVLLAADFQDPPEMIVKFVEAWEEGYRIAIGIKTASKENPVMYGLRSLYYHWIRRLSEVEQIEHFTGFGLYDRSFVDVLRKLDDPTPFLRGIVAELGFRRKEIPYTQPKRRAGKTSNNFYKLYDAAMLSVTSYTKFGLRLATFVGFLTIVISLFFAVFYLGMKLVYWDRFVAGQAPILISMLFLGAVIIFFIGMMGEYILTINQRVMRRPLVVEEERLNFAAGTPEGGSDAEAKAVPAEGKGADAEDQAVPAEGADAAGQGRKT